MNRTDILNFLIEKKKYTTYLEIGVQYGHNFTDINLPRQNKTSVDIQKQILDFDYVLDYEMTSDKFFQQNKNKYDLIFIDGDHEYKQSYQDVLHSLDCLNPNGTIVCHDCYPTFEELSMPNRMGTVYKTILNLRMNRPDLNVCVVNTDCGCGIITRNFQQNASNISADESLYDYKNFILNADVYLNLKEVYQFLSSVN